MATKTTKNLTDTKIAKLVSICLKKHSGEMTTAEADEARRPLVTGLTAKPRQNTISRVSVGLAMTGTIGDQSDLVTLGEWCVSAVGTPTTPKLAEDDVLCLQRAVLAEALARMAEDVPEPSDALTEEHLTAEALEKAVTSLMGNLPKFGQRQSRTNSLATVADVVRNDPRGYVTVADLEALWAAGEFGSANKAYGSCEQLWRTVRVAQTQGQPHVRKDVGATGLVAFGIRPSEDTDNAFSVASHATQYLTVDRGRFPDWPLAEASMTEEKIPQPCIRPDGGQGEPANGRLTEAMIDEAIGGDDTE